MNGVEKSQWGDFVKKKLAVFAPSILCLPLSHRKPRQKYKQLTLEGVGGKYRYFKTVAGHELPDSGFVALHCLLTTLNVRESQMHRR